MLLAKVVAIWKMNRALPAFCAALLLVNLGIFLWITYRLSPEVGALERTYIDSRTQARLAHQGSTLSPQERWHQAEGDLRSFRQAIPPEADFTALIGELFEIATDAGLGLDRVSYQPKAVGTDLLRYELGFSIRGDYRQVKTFIHELEQSPRIIAIEGISLAGQEADQNAVSLGIRISTYFTSDPS
jgi:type IV pilus assembly protein PilO